MGDGGKLPELGEKHLNMNAPMLNGINSVISKCQIANVTRPLMSVGHICDQGLFVMLDPKFAIVSDSTGKEVCRFTRGETGLYTAKISSLLLRRLLAGRGARATADGPRASHKTTRNT